MPRAATTPPPATADTAAEGPAPSAGESEPLALFEGVPTWIRNYAVEILPEEATADDARGQLGAVRDWTGADVLLLAEPDNGLLMEALRRRWVTLGARVTLATFAQATPANDRLFSHIVALMPRARTAPDVRQSLSALLDRLLPVASLAAKREAAGWKTAVVYVQFGGGHFGAGPVPAELETSCCLSFARSLHLERKELLVRVVDLAPALEPVRAADAILSESALPGPFRAAGYDAKAVRHVHRLCLQAPAQYVRRAEPWSSEDVILVTGGGKGVMATCALALARATRAKMVLVGSSPHPRDGVSSAAGDELVPTLERYREERLWCRYESCDVTDRAAVMALVERVRAEVGPITAVVHGAMAFRPCRIDALTTADAVQELAPKIVGAAHLLAALEGAPPGLFVGFTSISQLEGMPGSAAYALANEALEILVRRFGAAHASTATLCIAWSMWGEVGEAARLGSARQLQRLGLVLEEMDPTECAARFVQLMVCDPGTRHVLVTGRTLGFDTWPLLHTVPPTAAAGRFVDEIRYLEPGVELVTRTRITLERDRYLHDHVFHGMYILPTVIGLEAVAQTAAFLLGQGRPAIVRIEDTHMPWPIVVDAHQGVEIQLWAQADEPDGNGEQRVRVSLRTEQTEFQQDYVTAVAVFGTRREAPREEAALTGAVLPIKPREDLYGRRFFVGPLFQRIQALLASAPGQAMCLAEYRPASAAGLEGFAPSDSGPLLLGDPYFRDTLLHTAFLHDLQVLGFTARIGRIEFFRPAKSEAKPRVCISRLRSCDAREWEVDLNAVTEDGVVLERLEGFRLHIVEAHPEWASLDELAHAAAHDGSRICQVVTSCMQTLGLEPPALGMSYVPRIEQLAKSERHTAELSLVRRVLSERSGIDPGTMTLEWSASGKPQLTGATAPSVSFSHVDSCCLCVIGAGPQGCDLVRLAGRTQQEWLALLGDTQRELLAALVVASDPPDRAGARIWASLEAARKATGEVEQRLSLLRWQGDAALLLAESSAGRCQIATVSTELLPGIEFMIAVTPVRPPAEGGVQPAVAPTALADPSGSGDDLTQLFPGEDGIRVVREELLDCLMLERVLQVSWRECGNGRSVLSCHYVSWFYQLADLMLGQSIGKQFAADVAAGRWSGAVRSTESWFRGEAFVYERVRARLWVSSLDATAVGLRCLFTKLGTEKDEEPLALVGAEGCFFRRDGEEPAARGGRIEMPASHRRIYERFWARRSGSILAPWAPPVRTTESTLRGPQTGRLLHTERFKTTQVESDLVGTISAAQYFVWQEAVRDQFLNTVLPGHARRSPPGGGETAVQGHLVCLRASVDHLRPLEPFDEVQISLSLEAFSEREVRLRFEYGQVQSGGVQKVASGRQRIVWMVPDAADAMVPGPWPAALKTVFLPALPDSLLHTSLVPPG
jgi:enediyne polyketide synthase